MSHGVPQGWLVGCLDTGGEEVKLTLTLLLNSFFFQVLDWEAPQASASLMAMEQRVSAS